MSSQTSGEDGPDRDRLFHGLGIRRWAVLYSLGIFDSWEKEIKGHVWAHLAGGN